ncbi:MAG: hypothetical protein KGQ66_14690 [Acidobacteriota bacterium]|nr:hypothetical protein [Acidobacteriota bacterium]
MRPNPREEMALLVRDLEEVAGSDETSDAISGDLRQCIRTLRRIERSLEQMVPYLRADNERLAGFLNQLRSGNEATLDAGDLALLGSTPPPLTGNWQEDVTEANTRNESLRDLLGRVVRAGGCSSRQARADSRGVLMESIRSRPW